MTKCSWCGTKTQASSGRCQSCKSKRHHALERIKSEGLIVDTPIGNHSSNWWIWNKQGEVLVIGKNSRDEAVRALALGDVEDDDERSTSAPSAQPDRDNDHLARRKSSSDRGSSDEIARRIAGRLTQNQRADIIGYRRVGMRSMGAELAALTRMHVFYPKHLGSKLTPLGELVRGVLVGATPKTSSQIEREIADALTK